MSESKFGYGASPPPGAAWQIGKTAASITFVRYATEFLPTCEDQEDKDRLQRAIDEIKSGARVLTKWTTPEDFLKSRE